MKMKDLFYVLPHIRRVRNEDDEDIISNLDEVLSLGNCVLVSEPGSGKSRLLKEIILRCEGKNKNGLYIDLKRHFLNTIEETVLQFLNRPVNTNKLITNIELGRSRSYVKATNFKLLDSPSVVIVFDALDEVSFEKQIEFIEAIKDFHFQYSQVKIIISAREYCFKENENWLIDMDYCLLRINRFKEREVMEYLDHCGFSPDDQFKIIKEFSPGFELKTIDSVRILEMFVDLVYEYGLDEVLGKSKAWLIERFIYSKLELEEQVNRKNIRKEKYANILQSLALHMKVLQINEIKKED
ncbi:MAG: hypothetical protein WBA74_12175, partial [Cyclobacteriaceae bacterium]